MEGLGMKNFTFVLDGEKTFRLPSGYLRQYSEINLMAHNEGEAILAFESVRRKQQDWFELDR